MASTNAHGVATFVVVGTQVVDGPVCFAANLVNLGQFYPVRILGPDRSASVTET